MADYVDWLDSKPVWILLDPGDGTSGPKRLRNINGAIAVVPVEGQLTVISSGVLSVSTLTPVLAFTDLSAYKSVIFEGWTASADQINFLVERSSDGVHPDVEQSIVVMTSGKGGHIEVPLNLSTFWRLSAYTDSPFPTSVLNWKLSGLLRQV